MTISDSLPPFEDKSMNASEVMDPEPSTLKPTDTIGYGAEIIMHSRYRSLPVVDENFCYVGMFGVNCLLKQVIPKAVFLHKGLENISFIHESLQDLYDRFNEVRNQPISICLSHDIKAVAPDAPLTETLLQLYDTKSSIPVVDPKSEKLLGMISYFDVGRKILDVGANGHA